MTEEAEREGEEDLSESGSELVSESSSKENAAVEGCMLLSESESESEEPAEDEVSFFAGTRFSLPLARGFCS